MLAAVMIRGLLLVGYSLDTELPLASLVDGHDGAEYLAFARSLADGSIAGIPAEARRHGPGLPLFLAPVVKLTGSQVAAYWATLGGLLVALPLYCSTVLRHGAVGRRELALLPLALPLVYPTQVYFSSFVLTESLFIAAILAATWLFLDGRHKSAYVAVGFLALVRAPGIFLAPALFFSDLLARRQWVPRWSRLAAPLLSLLPPVIWAVLTGSIWMETNVTILRPVLGFPFSGFAGLGEVGTVRALYVLLAVGFFITSAALLLREAARAQWRSPLLNIATLFSGMFLLFHLCIKTFYYLDRTIYTFNYQDRYYVGLLPFALYAWRGALRPWNIALASLVSLLLAGWWGHNYFEARGL